MLKRYLAYDLSVFTSGYFPNRNENIGPQKLHTQIFIGILFMIIKNGKASKQPDE